MVLIPSSAIYGEANNKWIDPLPSEKFSSSPYQEVTYNVTIQIYTHSLKPRSAYKAAIGILNTVKNLLHQTSPGTAFNFIPVNSGAIRDVSIIDETFGKPNKYKGGFLQRASLDIAFLCYHDLWTKNTPRRATFETVSDYQDVQMKEVEEELVTAIKQIKAIKSADPSIKWDYLSKITGVDEGVMTPTAKFPRIYVTAEVEEEDRTMPGLNQLNREFDIDVITKQIPKNQSILDCIATTEELIQGLNIHLLLADPGLGGRMINNAITSVEYGQIRTNNLSLYASTLNLTGMSLQPRLAS